MSPELVDYVIGYIARDNYRQRRDGPESTMPEENKSYAYAIVNGAIDQAKQLLEDQYPTPSREKSMVLTKLDEAMLWLAAVRVLPR